MKRDKHKQYFIRKFLLYYLAIMLIPLGVVIYTYGNSYRSTLDAAREEQVQRLETASGRCETYFRGVKELAYEISVNYIIRQFVKSEKPSADNSVVADLYLLKDIISPYMITNEYVQSIVIGFKRSETIVANGECYLDMKAYWRETTAGSGLTYEEWYDRFFNERETGLFHQRLNWKSREGEYLIYRQPLTGTHSANNANVYIYLDLDQLQAVLQDVTGTEYGNTFFIRDDFLLSKDLEEAEILYRTAESGLIGSEGNFYKKIGNKSYLFVYRYSAQTGGYYLSAVPEKEILSQISGIRNLCIAVVFSTIAAGAVLIVIFTVRTAKPWYRIADILDEGVPENGVFTESFINEKIAGMIQKNQKLSSEAESWRPALKLALFHQLISGTASDYEELRRELKELGIDLSGTFFAVIILSLNEMDSDSSFGEMNACKILIKDWIGKNVSGVRGFYDMDMNKEAIILTSEKANYVEFMEDLETQLSRAGKYIQYEWELSISFSGSITDSLNKLSKCWREACTAENYERKLNNLTISWFKKTKYNTIANFYYPITKEQELAAGVERGRYDEVGKILDDIYGENFEGREIGTEPRAQLFGTIQATLYRIIGDNVEIQEAMHQQMFCLAQMIRDAAETGALWNQVKRVFQDLCRYYGGAFTENESLYDKVLAYVNQNFTDSQLSLTQVADLFGITEIYLSRFFKEKNGKNFSKYVEEHRMMLARELLDHTRDSIQSIAERTGYNSPQVFRRAYKKYYGCTPREKGGKETVS